jgi:1,4-alpha-glucan branching enzyme
MLSTQRRKPNLKPKPTARSRSTIHFEVEELGAASVFLAGTFNDWDATSFPLQEGEERGLFQADVPLAPGYYEYKFVVDGVWVADLKCPRWSVNEHGSLNSVLEVLPELAS